MELLGCRERRGGAGGLIRGVVRASAGPVIAAGSVASLEQIAALDAAGAWGFTIGGALFEGRLPRRPSVGGQVRQGLAAAAPPAAPPGGLAPRTARYARPGPCRPPRPPLPPPRGC